MFLVTINIPTFVLVRIYQLLVPKKFSITILIPRFKCLFGCAAATHDLFKSGHNLRSG